MKLTNVYPQNKARTESRVEVKKDSAPRAGATKSAETGAPASASDKVELSAHSRDVGRMQQILDSTPTVRTELVTEIKGKVDRGEYQVDAKDVADKMLMSLLTDTMKE